MSATQTEHRSAAPEEIWEILRQLAKRQKESEERQEERDRRREENESVVRHADRRGLFVIQATGSSASIVNEPDFRPRAFS